MITVNRIRYSLYELLENWFNVHILRYWTDQDRCLFLFLDHTTWNKSVFDFSSKKCIYVYIINEECIFILLWRSLYVTLIAENIEHVHRPNSGERHFALPVPDTRTRNRVSGNDFLQLKNLPGVRNALCPGVRNWEKTGRSDWIFIIMCDVMTGDRNEKDRVSVTKSTWSSEWMFITMYDVMSGDWNEKDRVSVIKFIWRS